MLMASELEREHTTGLTAYGSVKNATVHLALWIFGTGRLGLMVIQFAKSIMDLTDKLGADAVTDFINAYKTVETDMHSFGQA